MGNSYQIKAPHTSGHGRYGEIPHIPLLYPCMTVHNPISPHVFRRIHKIGTARRGRHGYCIFAAELRWRPRKCCHFLVLVEGSGVGGLDLVFCCMSSGRFQRQAQVYFKPDCESCFQQRYPLSLNLRPTPFWPLAASARLSILVALVALMPFMPLFPSHVQSFVLEIFLLAFMLYLAHTARTIRSP